MGAVEDWFIEESKRKSEKRNGEKNLFVCMFGMGILILILINFQKRIIRRFMTLLLLNLDQI